MHGDLTLIISANAQGNQWLLGTATNLWPEDDGSGWRSSGSYLHWVSKTWCAATMFVRRCTVHVLWDLTFQISTSEVIFFFINFQCASRLMQSPYVSLFLDVSGAAQRFQCRRAFHQLCHYLSKIICWKLHSEGFDSNWCVWICSLSGPSTMIMSIFWSCGTVGD